MQLPPSLFYIYVLLCSVRIQCIWQLFDQLKQQHSTCQPFHWLVRYWIRKGTQMPVSFKFALVHKQEAGIFQKNSFFFSNKFSYFHSGSWRLCEINQYWSDRGQYPVISWWGSCISSDNHQESVCTWKHLDVMHRQLQVMNFEKKGNIFPHFQTCSPLQGQAIC